MADALALTLAQARTFGVEKIALQKAFTRVLAQDVRADRDYPPFNRAMMDGFAIRTAGFDNTKSLLVEKTIFAGDALVSMGSALVASRIMTGAPVPKGADAVVKKEDTTIAGNQVRFQIESLSPWLNVARKGEDLHKGDTIKLKGLAIDSSVAGLLASLGVALPLVQRLPRVSIITTGNEIISLTKKPGASQVRNANIYALRALLHNLGIGKIKSIHVADDRASLTKAIRASLASDILLLTGGVSAGESDYVPEILSHLKVRKIFHKTAMKPGKPLWFGVKGKTGVFAIPGNPFSAQVVFKIFVESYIRACLGCVSPPVLALPLSVKRTKTDSLRHYFPARINANSLEAVHFNGSGDIRAGIGSHGLAIHPADRSEIRAGELVEFIPWH